MSTAVEPAEIIDPPAKPANEEGEEEENDEHPNEFGWYIKPEATHEILQKRWGLFFLLALPVYFYHFINVVLGLDMFCHWTRFQGCVGAGDFKEASAVYDTAICLVCIFHIIEWVRQSILMTTILVGYPWLPAYFFLSLNIPFGVIALIIGMAKGFGSE